VLHLEGSYDRFLMTETLVRGDLTFGRGGYAPALAGPGLGAEVAAGKVGSRASRRIDIPIPDGGD
jgi:hypothetical protein